MPKINVSFELLTELFWNHPKREMIYNQLSEKNKSKFLKLCTKKTIEQLSRYSIDYFLYQSEEIQLYALLNSNPNWIPGTICSLKNPSKKVGIIAVELLVKYRGIFSEGRVKEILTVFFPLDVQEEIVKSPIWKEIPVECWSEKIKKQYPHLFALSKIGIL